MFSNFNPVTLIIGAVVILLFLICALSCKRIIKKIMAHKNTIEHIEESVPHGQRVVLAKNMTENELSNAINTFLEIYNEDGNNNYVAPEIKKGDEGFFLLFEPTLDYRSFCFWVNYLIYSDKNKRHNNDIIGWYEVGNANNNHPFSNKMLMLFIPDSDNEFDNVYLVDDSNKCYIQEFSFNEKIIPLKKSIIRYQEIPDINQLP